MWLLLVVTAVWEEYSQITLKILATRFIHLVTVVGIKHASAIGTLVERKTRLNLIVKIINRKSDTVTTAFKKSLNMMAINFRKTRFIGVAADLAQCPVSDLPEIVLSGRSNVGKSSLINALADNRQLAKISSTPGKTRLIIYFNVDEKLLLTDLPGYGFAQVSQQTRVAFSALADRYLESGRPIALVLHLLDIRHDPSIQDLQMIEWLKSRNLESFVILSKSDKLSRSQALRRRKEIAALYEELLKDVAGITLPPDHPGHAHHLFCIRVDAAIRRDVFDQLKQAQLGVQVHYVPVHRYTYYQKNFGFYEGQFPKAELFSAQAISIPIFPDMTDADVHRVVEEIKGALSHCLS